MAKVEPLRLAPFPARDLLARVAPVLRATPRAPRARTVQDFSCKKVRAPDPSRCSYSPVPGIVRQWVESSHGWLDSPGAITI